MGEFWDIDCKKIESSNSALSDKSLILHSDSQSFASSKLPQSSLENNDFSSQILELPFQKCTPSALTSIKLFENHQNSQSTTAKQAEGALSLVNARILFYI